MVKATGISTLVAILLLTTLDRQVNAAGYFSQEPGVPSNTIGAGIHKSNPTFNPISSSSSSSKQSPPKKVLSPEEESAKKLASQTESFMENLFRQFYVSILGKTHVQVTEIKERERLEKQQRENPIWHPFVKNFDSDQDLLAEDQSEDEERRKRGEEIDDWLDRRIRGNDLKKDFRPWIILVSEGSTDKTSREVDSLFNSTLNILFPPGDTKARDWIPLPLKDAKKPIKKAIKAGSEIVKEAISERLDSEASQDGGDSDDFSSIEKSSKDSQSSSSSSSSSSDLTEKEKARIQKTLTLSSSYSLPASEFQFGHMKYIKEADLAWRFWIWKVPVLLFVTPSTSPSKRLYDLRYYPISFAPKTVDSLLNLWGIQSRWMSLKIWDSDLNPGGEKDWIPKMLAKVFGGVYVVLDPIPSWILMMLSTAGTMGLIGFLHSLDSKGKEEKKSDEKKVLELKKEVQQVEKDVKVSNSKSSGVKSGNGSSKKRK